MGNEQSSKKGKKVVDKVSAFTGMGNAQPTNKTGRKVVDKKLEHATKTGVLSLSEHSLEQIPSRVLE